MAYAFYRSITIDHTKVPNTNQTDFPVLISGTYAWLATVANGGDVTSSSGYDIIFTSDSGGASPLDFERVGYSATTGLVEFWVRIPTLSYTVDTVIYIQYSDAGVTTDQSTPTSVWDSNFKAVYHLPNGTSLTANDSTSGGFNGTLVNTPTAGTGKIDGGGSFVRASSQYVQNANAVMTPFPITISAWVTATGAFGTGDDRVIAAIMRKSSANAEGFWLSILEVSGSIYLRAVAVGAGSPRIQRQTSAYGTPTSLHHVVASCSSSTSFILYVDGTAVSSGSVGAAATPSSLSDTFVGGLIYNTSTVYGNWNGVIDEVRISNVARSADWILADYNSTNSPATFYSISGAPGSGKANYYAQTQGLF